MGLRRSSHRRRAVKRRTWLILAIGLGAAAYAQFWRVTPEGEEVYALTDCHVAQLRDPKGARIVGAEDIALSADGAELTLSAHDRLAPGDAPAGIFLVPLADLLEKPQLTVHPVLSLERPLRPHGLALSGDHLAFVNRPAPGKAEIVLARREGDNWREAHVWRGTAFCRANDLTFLDQPVLALVITLDRGSCALSLRDLTPWSASGAVVMAAPFAPDPTGISVGWRFPNGITPHWLAETRAGRVTRLGGASIKTPGGPDNLTEAPDGSVIAALHPSLTRLALYRHGLVGTAPSRLVRLTQSGQITILFDDREGALFPGASVGVEADGVLIAGSMRAPGLLVCRKRVS